MCVEVCEFQNVVFSCQYSFSYLTNTGRKSSLCILQSQQLFKAKYRQTVLKSFALFPLPTSMYPFLSCIVKVTFPKPHFQLDWIRHALVSYPILPVTEDSPLQNTILSPRVFWGPEARPRTNWNEFGLHFALQLIRGLCCSELRSRALFKAALMFRRHWVGCQTGTQQKSWGKKGERETAGKKMARQEFVRG